jgi:hypothetical protein
VNGAGLISAVSHSDGFYVTLLSSLAEMVGISAIQVYPNPFSESLFVKFQLQTTARLSIRLERLDGSLLYQQEGQYGAGPQRIRINIPSNLSTEVCLLRILVNNQEIQPFQLIHTLK